MEKSSGDQNITFADLGVKPRVATTDSYFGKRRNFSDLDRWELIFLVSSLVGLLATIGLTIERIIRIQQDDDDKDNPEDFTFALLILINSLFVIYYTIDGVFRERAYELAVFIIAVSIIIIYCITNYAGTFDKDAIDAVKTARLVLVIALGPLNIILGFKLTKQYYESRNLIFRTVGANTELQDMCSLMFFFEALLKFDLQLAISIFVLVLTEGTHETTTAELVLLITGLAYSIAWVILGYIAMRFEKKVLVWIFIATSVLEPAYIVYKMVDLGINWTEYTEFGVYLAVVTIICAAAALNVRVTLVVTMHKIYLNFGKGLKEKAFGSRKNEEETRILPDDEDGKPVTYNSADDSPYG